MVSEFGGDVTDVGALGGIRRGKGSDGVVTATQERNTTIGFKAASNY